MPVALASSSTPPVASLHDAVLRAVVAELVRPSPMGDPGDTALSDAAAPRSALPVERPRADLPRADLPRADLPPFLPADLPLRVQQAIEAARAVAGAHELRLRPGVAKSEPDNAIGSQHVRAFPLANSAVPGGLVLQVRADDPAVIDEGIWAPVAELLAMTLRDEMARLRLEREVSAQVSELAAQRRFIERIVDSLPLGLYVVDRGYRIQAWNHKRETGLQGVSRHRAIGQTIFEVLHRQPAAVLKREFDEVFASGRMQQFQMESAATGSVRTFRLSKIPMCLDDARPTRVTHVITIGEDITDWRAAVDRTAQSEKLAALGHMATGIMHEINNPLATIAACAETLTLQSDDRERAAGVPAGDPRELLRIVDLEVQRCKRIVEGLLDFARPKPVQLDELDLNAVVAQVLFLLQHHPRHRNVSLVTELDASVPLRLRGDADRLVQVLMALVLNALDASADGARVLLRTSALRSSDGPALALDVVDEGHGIPRESLPKVFEPFYTTKAPGRGTGLGLSICYGLVMEHGGLLAVDSALGQGATFRILLPALGTPSLSASAPRRPLVHEPLGRLP